MVKREDHWSGLYYSPTQSIMFLLPSQKIHMVVVGRPMFPWFHSFQMLVQDGTQAAGSIPPSPLKAGILPAYVRKAPFHRAKATAVKPCTPKRRLVIFNGKDRPSNQKHDVRIQRCLWWFVFVTVFESANTLPPSQNLYNTQTLTIMICSVLLCIHIYIYIWV